MNNNAEGSDQDLPFRELQHIDAVCDEFERAWNKLLSPRIEDVLDKHPDLPRSPLLFELVSLECSFRDRAGESSEKHEYLKRFPEDQASIERVWQKGPARPSADEEPTVMDPGMAALANKQGRAEKWDLPEKIGEFTILRQLGRGGMGIVYEAEQESLKRTVALKILPLAGRFDQRQIQRFQNEASAAAQLNHENIVPVYSVGIDGGVHYYAMQLIHGHDLAHFIHHATSLVNSKVGRPSGETPLPVGDVTAVGPSLRHDNAKRPATDAQSVSRRISYPSVGFVEMMAGQRSSMAADAVFLSIVQIGIHAAEALHHAHLLGIVHRDIKPSNLMLDEQGKVWVTDFGLAQVQGGAALTMTGEVVGTLRYMSPEQPLGQRVLVDQRTDIYSLGVTLYELLTLKKAYGGETPKEIIKQVCFDDPTAIRRLNPGVPDDLETIVLKAMSKNPDDRYQTAQELADDLRRFSQDLPILARRPTVIQRCRRWIRRHLALATSAAAAVVVLCLTSMAASALIWNALTAESQQRRRAESLLEKSEGLRLTANSSLERDKNPGLALALAVRGAELNPGVDANAALLSAMRNNHELKTFSPRTEISDQLSISPDRQRVVTTIARSWFGKGSYPAIESDLATGQTLRTFDDGTAITSAAYSPDGKLLLTTSSPFRNPAAASPESPSVPGSNPIDSVPSLWNASTGDRMISLNDASLDVVLGTEFSQDSGRIALPGRDNTVRIYSTADGQLDRSLKGHTARVIAASFSPDGKRLVSTALDQTLRVWDLESGTELQKFPVKLFSRPEQTAAFADTDNLVISTGEGTRIVSINSGQQLNPRHWSESASAVSRDGRQVALFLEFGKHLAIRDTQSFRLVTEFDVDDFIISVEFSADGGRILLTTASQASVHRCEDGALVARLQGHTGMLSAGRFTPDGENVVTAAEDATIRFWSVQNGEERLRLVNQPATIAPSPWGFSQDSAVAVVATERVWHSELRDAAGLPISAKVSGRVSSRTVNSNRLVTTDDHQISVWNVPFSRRTDSLVLPSETALEAMAVPGTDVVVVLVERGPAIFWNTATEERILTGDADDVVLDVDVHPTAGSVALAQQNGGCLVLNAVTGSTISTLPHEKGVLAVSFSATGSMLLTVDSADTVRVWSPDKDVPVQTLNPADCHIHRALFSADESAILTWSVRQHDCVRCWKTQTGELIAKTDPIVRPGVSVHPSESIAAIASVVDGLTLWNWTTGEQRRLSEAPAKTPVFLGNHLMSVEAVPGFQVADTALPGYGGSPEFARSVLTIYDVETAQLVSSEPLASEPWRLCNDQDTGQVIFSFMTHDVDLIRMSDQRKISSVGGHAAPIVFETVAGEIPRIVCASMDGTVSIWDLSGRRLSPPLKHEHPIVNAAISPEGLRLATFDTAGQGMLWNVENGQSIMNLPGHTGMVPLIRFSGSGKQLLTSGSDSTIHIWDLISKTETQLTFNPGVISAEWSPDESRLLVVTGEVENSLKDKSRPTGPPLPSAALLLELRTGAKTNLEADGMPQFGRFRPNGKQFAIVSNDRKVTLYDTATGQADTKFNPNRRPVDNIAFSPDGQDLLLMHDDELSLWDLDVGDEINRIPKADWSAIGQLLLQTAIDWNPFSPDGEWILSARPNLEKWPRDPLKEALKQVPRPLTDAENKQFSVNLILDGSGK